MASVKIWEARRQVIGKTNDTYSRNVFIIVHWFDYPWTEVFNRLLAPCLKPPNFREGLDTIWILWVSEDITVWSSKVGEWLNFKFGSFDPDKVDNDGLRSIQDIETHFLDCIGYTRGSPFLFGFDTSDDEAD
jgi:hypothetical protein